MNEQNFLKRMNDLVVGDGFIREQVVPLSAVACTDTPAIASKVLSTTLDTVDEFLKIPVDLPKDFSESLNELWVGVLAERTAGTAAADGVTLTVDEVGRVREGVAAVLDASTKAKNNSNNIISDTLDWYYFKIEAATGQTFAHKPGDRLTVELSAIINDTAADDGTIEVYGVCVLYRSSLAADDQDKRSVESM